MGRPSAVYDKTTLAVLWQARRDGVELDFLWLPFLKHSASYHIMLWPKLKVRGGDGWCVNLGGITKNLRIIPN